MLQAQDTHSLSELKNDFTAKGPEADFILGALSVLTSLRPINILKASKRRAINPAVYSPAY